MPTRHVKEREREREREKMHTQRRYATCPQGVPKKRKEKEKKERENIAHTKKKFIRERIHMKEFHPPSTKNIHTLAYLDQGL